MKGTTSSCRLLNQVRRMQRIRNTVPRNVSIASTPADVMASAASAAIPYPPAPYSEKVYPLGWRGVMCGTTPCSEILRANSARFCAGFQAFTNIEPQRNLRHGAAGLSLTV